MRRVLATLLLPLLLWAQPRIVIDPRYPERDTLEFGSTLVGIPVVRPLYLINPTEDSLVLPTPLQPFFSIERTPDQSSDVFDFLEFAPQDTFPVLVPPRQTRLLFLRFEAIREFYPLGEKRADLRLSLRYSRDTTAVAAERTLVLRGAKAEVVLELLPPGLSADSVFLGATRCVDARLRIALLPALSGRIDTSIALRSRVRFRSLPEQEEFSWDSPTSVPARPAELPLRFCYRPLDAGPDTAVIEFLYRRYPGAPEEQSTSILLTGFGVVHRWEWEPEEAAPGVRLLGDTIDFGRVRLGNQVAVRLRLRHGGNYRFHAVDTLVALTPEAEQAFRAVPSPFPSSGIAPAEELEVQLLFVPQSAGLARAAYQLRSDLGKRVIGVPPEARQWNLFLQGVGVGPRLHVSPPLLELRFPWSSRCPRSAEYGIVLQNTGTDVLQIDSLQFRSGVGLWLPWLSLPLLLNPGEQYLLRLRVEPPAAGEFSDTLMVWTNVPGASVSRLPIRVLAVQPAAVTLQLPRSLRVKPGSLVWVPIHIDTVPEGVSRCRLVLSYESSLLRWETLRTVGTALEGAQVQAREEQPGVLVVEALQPHGWLLPRQLLLELGFRAFLGKRPSTALAIPEAQLGDTLCPAFWLVSAYSGHVTLDSVCGLEAKLLPEGPLRLEIAPNPAAEQLQGSYTVPVEGELELALFNTAGIRLRTLVQGRQPAGTYVFRESLLGLPAGTYFCWLRFADIVLVRPFTLQR